MDQSDYSLEGRVDGALPPTTVGLSMEVVRITSTQNRHFVMLSEKPFGAWFHWFGRSVPCTNMDDCERCKSNQKKWRGYIHALELLGPKSKEVIIELTHTAIVMIDVQLCTQPLRGSQIKFCKTKGGKHGRFVIEILPRRIGGTTLPDPKSPESYLRRLWKINEDRDVPDPLV